jgi:FtsP/CotA-like multicopper oxidase with cupredoxin domain
MTFRPKSSYYLGAIVALTLSTSIIATYAGAQTAQPTGPLRNMPVCSTARLMPPNAANTAINCVPNRAKKRVRLTLKAQSSPIKIGDYTVETENYNGFYFAPVLEVRPGDTLSISLANGLPTNQPMVDVPMGAEMDPTPLMNHPMSPTQTNLHTHGLIVAPRNSASVTAKQIGNGDNPYMVLDNKCLGSDPLCRTSAQYSIRIPTVLAANVADDVAGRPHPSGLSWYHPHIHGLAQRQVSGGMTGLISVGDPRDSIVGYGGGPNSKIDVRYLVLKDIQLLTDQMPEQASVTAGAMGEWQKEFDPGFCGDPAPGIPALAGYCRGPDTATGKKSLWLFTVNGQRFPQIDIAGGRGHLWRLANLSATVSYVLQLRNEAGNLIPMKLVALDGVVAGRARPHPAGTRSSLQIIEKTSILVMPASRVEVIIPNFAPHNDAKTYTLSTRGFNTGADNWLPVDLSMVRLAPSAGATAAPIDSLVPPAVVNGQPALTALAMDPTSRRASDLTPGTLCAHRLAANERRFIRLVADPKSNDQIEALEIGAGISNNLDTMENGAHGNVFPADGKTMQHGMAALDDANHGCAVLGDAPEIWEVRNDTDEIHNFHIHQSKFKLASEAEIVSVTAPQYRAGHPRRGATTNPSASLDADLFNDNRPELAVWHDTIPVEAHNSVYIKIAFAAPEQVGRFMFHCHILEHEDKGMMAGFEVVRP